MVSAEPEQATGELEQAEIVCALLLPSDQEAAIHRHAVFWSYQNDLSGHLFYETLDMRFAKHPQSILAFNMNGEALSVAHGAPLRLRVETELGFKMV